LFRAPFFIPVAAFGTKTLPAAPAIALRFSYAPWGTSARQVGFQIECLKMVFERRQATEIAHEPDPASKFVQPSNNGSDARAAPLAHEPQMSTQTENRYALRQEKGGTWTVCEIYTGRPAVVGGVTLENLYHEEAQTELDRLNNLLVDRRENASK
jgi:hypothetical protein